MALQRLCVEFSAVLARCPLPPWDEHGWHECGPDAELVATFLAVLNAMNWCFWPTEGAIEYEQVARGLAGAARGGALMPCAKLQAFTAEDVARWVPGISDAEERASRVREVGCALARCYGGSALALIDAAGGSAAVLVRLVADAFPGFRDQALYVPAGGGSARQVFFYKRAQILVGDFYGALGGRSSASRVQHPGAAFRDIGQLTCFADYRIPQLLAAEGALVYSAELAERVRRREELYPGSREEVEIRAATVEAVNRLQLLLSAEGRAVTCVEVDWLLWNTGETRLAHLPPHHRTRSVFY